jgi:predicted phosphodiesterase
METSDLDFLFYGHTHVAAERQNGGVRVINPGALYRARIKTFVILDTKTGHCESIVLPEADA